MLSWVKHSVCGTSHPAIDLDLIIFLLVRNAYTLLNWGDFVDQTSAARGTPYIQMEPMTGQSQAHKEFVAARLGGVDTTGDPQWKLSSHQQSSPVSKGERVQHIEAFVSSVM